MYSAHGFGQASTSESRAQASLAIVRFEQAHHVEKLFGLLWADSYDLPTPTTYNFELPQGSASLPRIRDMLLICKGPQLTHYLN